MDSKKIEPASQKKPQVVRQRESPSFFGPVVLIAGGSYFLLNNLGVLPALNWGAAARMWPLLLIFAGLNMILRQARRPFGAILSLLVTVAAVASFGYFLLGPDMNSSWPNFPPTTEVTSQILQLDSDAPAADINIDFSAAGGDLYALRGSPHYIEAEISYLNALEVDWDGDDPARASLQIDTDDSGASVFGAATGLVFGPEDRWQIGLPSDASLAVELDLGSGVVNMDLAELQLEDLIVDGGSGAAELILPAGDYQLAYDIGSGATTIQLGSAGTQQIVLDGGSGRLRLLVPAGVPVRLEVEAGSGRLNLDDRFRQVGDRGDITIWETVGFDEERPHVSIYLDLGSGSASSELP